MYTVCYTSTRSVVYIDILCTSTRYYICTVYTGTRLIIIIILYNYNNINYINIIIMYIVLVYIVLLVLYLLYYKYIDLDYDNTIYDILVLI